MIILNAFVFFDYEDIKSKFRDVNNRILFIAFLFLAFFSAIAFKIFFLQVIQHEAHIAKLSRDTEFTSRETFERSTIYDRDGRILAASVKKPSIYINPAETRSVLEPVELAWFADILSERTGRTVNYIMNAVARESHFSYISRLVASEDFERIMEINELAKEKLGGKVKTNLVKYKIEYDRIYPFGDSISHLLGRTDSYGVGKEGLELVFDKYLRQVPGEGNKNTIDGRGRVMRVSSVYKENQSRKYDLTLTISQPVQQKAHEINEELCARYEPLYSIILVQEVSSGDLLAFSVLCPEDSRDQQGRFAANPAVAFSYEPGSTFKTVSFAYLIENNLVDIYSDKKLNCENGVFNLGRYRFHDAHPYNELKPMEVFSKSSNIGTIKLSRDIPRVKWIEFLKNCGFGTRTGISLSAESSGSLTNIAVLNDEHSRLLSFIGQGISVTPVQLLAFYQAIANDGVMEAPKVVKYLSNSLFEKIDLNGITESKKRVITEKTARIMRELLRQVVLSGTGKKARVDSVETAGKTGTAQIFNTETGSYYKGRFISSFIGMAPAETPEIAVMVIVHSPRGEYYGGAVAAPYFARITEFTINYLNFTGKKYIRKM